MHLPGPGSQAEWQEPRYSKLQHTARLSLQCGWRLPHNVSAIIQSVVGLWCLCERKSWCVR